MTDLSVLHGLAPDEKVVELHAHSSASDGSDAPEKVARRARRAGIRALALTDHDTLAGLARAGEEAEKLGMALVPGVELSCVHEGRAAHMLGHFVRPDAPRLAGRVAACAADRVERMREIIARLARGGLPIDGEDFFAAHADAPSVTRGQLAGYMLSKGLAGSRAEVFEKYIGEGAAAYVALDAPSPFEAIAIVQEAGGAATLAHPVSSGCDGLIPALAEAGLAGLEVEHPSQDEEARARYARMAEECGLLRVGGSDCHGVRRGGGRLGRFPQPLRLLFALSERAGARRAESRAGG